MRIALCGGTGDIGAGLALRFACDTDHELLIGSRDPEKARATVEEYRETLEDRDLEASIKGFDNAMAADRADVVVLAVPPYHVRDTVESIADRLDSSTTLVSPAVGMQRDDAGLHYNRPSAGSVTAMVAASAPDEVPIVGAFHSLSAGKLADLDRELSEDTLLVGDDEDGLDTVERLAEGIEGLRALRAGPIANAAEVESLTPLLINLAGNNADLHDVGVRFE
ncbi:NADPH-dependent F420 reductase [Halalkalicoccus tibetensis]|uniref:NADPH-dependent F420 reductase n=1 Tax=Halalkalicoccus tibetensis TaxID=175632 RepID=A0ABD5V158_9EURY